MFPPMFPSTFRRLSGLVVAVFAFLTTNAFAVQANRIASTVSNASRVQLQGTISNRAQQSQDLGAAAPDTKLSGLMIRFSMTTAQAAQMQQLQSDLQSPSSGRYHQWLTPEQYADQFGVSTADLAKVTSWLTAQGFKVNAASRSRSFVGFSGTAAQAQSAFGTSIHSVLSEGETHFTNLSEPTIPAALSGVVGTVRGLNDFKPRPSAKLQQVQSSAAGSPNFNFSTGNGLVPGDLQIIYDVSSLISSGTNGSGVNIGIVGQSDVDLTPIASFRSLTGLPATTINVVTYGDDPGIFSDDTGESQLDLQWAGAAAPNASIYFYTSTDVTSSLQYAIDSNNVQIISTSYGYCEAQNSSSFAAYYDALAQQANAQGITILTAAGDSGAAGCANHGDPTVLSGVLSAPTVPGSMTAVGGTEFNEGSATSTYWNSSNGTNGVSAKSYIPEVAWNETSSSNGLLASGGGSSIYYTKPAWQIGTGVPTPNTRDTPDIALNAAANHDPYVVCATDYCVNGTFANAQGFISAAGGTSASAPSFAGILALIVQKQGPQGNINPTLYALANNASYSSSVFHDITSGNNIVNCSGSCTGNGTIGYNAGVGFDLVTGWGSVDGAKLAADWPLVTPLPSVGSTASATTLTAPATGVINGSATFTVKVASGSASVTTVPTGYVAISVNKIGYDYEPLVNGTFSVPLSLASSLLGTNTPAFQVGPNAIVANYFGDGTFAKSSSATLTLTLTQPTTTSTTTLTANPTTVALGAKTNVTITVAGSGGTPTGSVALRLTNTFYPNGINIASGTLTNGGATASITADPNYFVTGSNTLTANYLGDQNFAGSGSAALTLTVQGVSLTPATANLTVASGATTTANFTVGSLGGYTGTVTFSASTNSSTLDACVGFANNSLTLAANGTASNTFSFTAASCGNNSNAVSSQRLSAASESHCSLPWSLAGGGTALAALLLFVMPRRRKWMSLLAVLLSVGFIGLSGCGGGSSSNSGGSVTKVPPGTYTIFVTATGSPSTITTSSTVTITVQ